MFDRVLYLYVSSFNEMQYLRIVLHFLEVLKWNQRMSSQIPSHLDSFSVMVDNGVLYATDFQES